MEDERSGEKRSAVGTEVRGGGGARGAARCGASTNMAEEEEEAS